MVRSNNWVRVLLGGAIAATVFFLVAQSSHAVTQNEAGKSKTMMVVKYTLTPKIKMTKVFENGDMKRVRFHNTGKPVNISIHNDHHALGTNDFVDVDLPNVKGVFVHIVPADARDSVLPVRTPVGDWVYVKLEPQKNQTVSDGGHMGDIPKNPKR